MGVLCFGVAGVGGMGCEPLVLLYAYGISMMYVGCCVFGDVMSPVVSLESVGLKATRGRLRLLVCAVCVWWLGHLIVVRLVC